MSETTKPWYEVVSALGVTWSDDPIKTLDFARAVAVEMARVHPNFAPFRVIRVTETREEVT